MTVLLAALAAALTGTAIVLYLNLEINKVSVVPCLEALGVIVGFSGIVGFLSGIPSMMAIHRLSPVQILSSEVEND